MLHSPVCMLHSPSERRGRETHVSLRHCLKSAMDERWRDLACTCLGIHSPACRGPRHRCPRPGPRAGPGACPGTTLEALPECVLPARHLRPVWEPHLRPAWAIPLLPCGAALSQPQLLLLPGEVCWLLRAMQRAPRGLRSRLPWLPCRLREQPWRSWACPLPACSMLPQCV